MDRVLRPLDDLGRPGVAILDLGDRVAFETVQLTLPQIQFSFVEGAPFHEIYEKQASGPHTNTLGREIKILI